MNNEKQFNDNYYYDKAKRIKQELMDSKNTKASTITIGYIAYFCREWDKITKELRDKYEGTDRLSKIKITLKEE